MHTGQRLIIIASGSGELKMHMQYIYCSKFDKGGNFNTIQTIFIKNILHVFFQASRTNFTVLKSTILSQILTIEANVCLPSKLAIFRVFSGKWK